MKKRLLSLFIVLTMLMSFVPVVASAATSGTCGDNLTWTLDDNGTLTISGMGKMWDWSSMNAPWYNNTYYIKNVVIKDGVTNIGACAFYRCNYLENVTISNSVISIGRSAFSGCSSLTSITIPESVTEICGSAFYNCINLSRIIISDNVTSIGASAFYNCSSLTSITIPESVTEICRYTFYNCSSLTSITIPESVTSIDTNAFCNCDSLTSITIFDRIVSINDHAFRYCDNLVDVYYSGSETEWQGVKIGLFNDSLTNATIHYNSTDGGTTGTPTPTVTISPDVTPHPNIDTGKYASVNNNIKINGRGNAFLYYELKDTSGNILANKPIYCKFTGYNMISNAVTGSDGSAVIVTPELDATTDLEFTIYAQDGTKIADNVKNVYITVEGLSYEQSWIGQFGVGAGAEIAWGVKGRLGPAEAGAKIASAGLNGKMAEGLTLKESYKNGNRSLELSSITDAELSGKLDAGLWADAEVFKKFGTKIDVGSLGAGASFGADQMRTLKIENYDPTNSQHLAQVSYFLMGAISGSQVNVLIHQITECLSGVKSYNEEGNSYTLTATAGADLGGVTIEATDSEPLNLYTIGEENVWSSSYKKNSAGNMVYSSSFGTSVENSIGNLNLSYANKSTKSDTKYNTAIYTGDILNNSVEITTETNGSSVKNLELSLMEKSSSGGFLWNIENENYNKVFSYSDDQAELAIGQNSALVKLSQGKEGFMNPNKVAKSVDSILHSGANADYSRNKKMDKGFDVELGIGLTAGVGVDLSGAWSGMGGYEFEYENGVLKDGIVYRQSESTAEQDIINSKKDFNEILAEPIQHIGSAIAGKFSSITGKIKDGVNKGKALVKGIKDWTATIVSSNDTSATSYAILSVSDEMSLMSTASVSVTVGNPYMIEVKDSSGNVITDFSSSPLQLTLEYDDADLSAAGLSNTTADLENLKIYRFDDSRGVYICVGGTLDMQAQCVETDIIYPGQYILAVDNCAPSVTDFIVSDYTEKPVFKATVADMSGIDDFSFKIDGKEVVNSDNLNNFYSDSSAVFIYECTENLSNGSHIATIMASDTAGNIMAREMSVEFTVDTQAPVIGNVKIIADENGVLNISADVQDDNLSSVMAYVEVDDKIYTYQLQEKSGTWTSEIDVPVTLTVSAWVEAYDTAGNYSASSKRSVEVISDNYMYVIHGVEIFNRGATVTVKSRTNRPANLILSAYDANDALVGVNMQNVSVEESATEEINLTINARNAVKFKVFVWDSLYGMVPVGGVFEKTVGTTTNSTPTPTAKPTATPKPTSTPSVDNDVIANGTCGDGLTWTLNNEGTLTISGTGAMTDWSSASDVPWYSYKSNIKSLVINEGATKVGNRAFSNYIALESVKLSEGITAIAGRAFEKCTGLTSITLPDSLETISSSAFWGCDGLTSITLPENVKSVGGSALSGNYEIFVDNNNQYFKSLDGVLYNKAGTEIIQYPTCKTESTYTLPSDVEKINKYAFYNCSNLTSIVIPASVTEIKDYAFRGCGNLSDVTVLSTNATFGTDVFSICSSSLVLKGCTGSTTETYASENNHTFEVLKTLYLEVEETDGEYVTLSVKYAGFENGIASAQISFKVPSGTTIASTSTLIPEAYVVAGDSTDGNIKAILSGVLTDTHATDGETIMVLRLKLSEVPTEDYIVELMDGTMLLTIDSQTYEITEYSISDGTLSVAGATIYAD